MIFYRRERELHINPLTGSHQLLCNAIPGYRRRGYHVRACMDEAPFPFDILDLTLGVINITLVSIFFNVVVMETALSFFLWNHVCLMDG